MPKVATRPHPDAHRSAPTAERRCRKVRHKAMPIRVNVSASRPDRHHRGAVGAAGAGARPDPLRPDEGVAVPVLPRRGGHHGHRPGHDPGERHARPVCGDAHMSTSDSRLAGAPPDVRHQRLRRDAARAMGVGRQAARHEPGHRRPANGFTAKQRATIVRAAVGRTATGCATSRPWATSTSGTPRSTSAGIQAECANT